MGRPFQLKTPYETKRQHPLIVIDWSLEYLSISKMLNHMVGVLGTTGQLHNYLGNKIGTLPGAPFTDRGHATSLPCFEA